MTSSSEPLELFVDKTVFGGDGLAHYQGKVYFIEGALTGETVLARVVAEKKNFSRAEIIRILEPSKHRINPPCRYVAHCGGCQYQHVEYSQELRMKEAQLLEILKTVPGLDVEKISPIAFSEKEYGYRNSVTLHPIYSKKKKSAILGFIGKDNVTKIPIKSCLLLDDRFTEIFDKELLFKDKPEKITFKLSENGEIVPDIDEIFYRVRMGEESFLAGSQGFFQNNLAVASLLADKVSRWVASCKPDTFFDLYSGVGVFSILCAKTAARIVCIEESEASVQALKMNREEKKIQSMEIIQGRVEKLFPQAYESNKSGTSMVLLDPPRQGLSAELAFNLAKKQGIHSLVYISCDPVTLARDLKIILSLGQWQVSEIAPFDMFPRTKHLEVAVILSVIAPSQN